MNNVLFKEMLAALKQAELTTAQLCQGQDPANQCWVALSEIRVAIAKAEAAGAEEAQLLASYMLEAEAHDAAHGISY